MTYALVPLCVPASGDPARNSVKRSPSTKFFHLLNRERCLSDIGTRHTAFARVRTMLDHSARLDEDTGRRPAPSLLPPLLSALPFRGRGRFACSCMASIRGVASPRFANTVIGKVAGFRPVEIQDCEKPLEQEGCSYKGWAVRTRQTKGDTVNTVSPLR